MKCRVCKKSVTRADSIMITYNDKNVYFCCGEHVGIWKKEQDAINIEREKLDVLYKFIKYDILNYKDEMNLPTYFMERIVDLRNGTVAVKGKGRVIKSKSGYPYEVITETFKDNFESIKYCFNTKTFKNEQQQLNYMMAIIENKINDSYVKWAKEQKRVEFESKKENTIDLFDLDDDKVIDRSDEEKKDLSSFFTDWE